ncbi:MAG TPA: response regulator, partial [Myxococcota bacterium]|nr:response regulator [Myxococcota bacterium]
VSQILRNFISNALKFTERGEVRVEARLADDGASVVFAVRDTGIGIALEDREMIFEEFTQVPSQMQRRVKGTGLGLPLCRKLAGLLGGEVFVDSEPGKGSSFFARIPVRYPGEAERAPPPAADARERLPSDGEWVLVIEDDEATRLLYEKFLEGTRYAAVPVPSIAEARELLRTHRPAAVILDILLPGEEEKTWRWLSEIKEAEDTLPVIVVTQTGEQRKAYSLGVDAYFDKPVDRERLLAKLDEVTRGTGERLALIIDDDAAARYVIRRSLRRWLRFEEAGDGETGLEAAARLKPGVIFLDLAMPGLPGEEVLERLKADPATAAIPVVVVTSREVDAQLRRRLGAHARAILHKRELSVEVLERMVASIEWGRAP